MENKYIAQARKGEVHVLRYILGIVLVTVGALVFSYPYRYAIDQKVAKGELDAYRIDDFDYLMSSLDSNFSLFFMMLPFAGGLLFLFFVMKNIHKSTWTFLTTSRKKIDLQRVLFSFALWGGINAIVILASVLVYPEEIFWNFDVQKFAILFVIAIIMVPLQTSFEEYIFRGYLMQGLGIASKTNWFPLVCTSVIFGLLHISNPEVGELGYGIMLFYIGTGFLLGIFTLMDEGMELSLGFHAANNLISALMITTDWSAFRTYALFRDTSEPNLMIQLGAVMLFYPLLLFIFAKKYQWTHWKEKLV